MRIGLDALGQAVGKGSGGEPNRISEREDRADQGELEQKGFAQLPRRRDLARPLQPIRNLQALEQTGEAVRKRSANRCCGANTRRAVNVTERRGAIPKSQRIERWRYQLKPAFPAKAGIHLSGDGAVDEV